MRIIKKVFVEGTEFRSCNVCDRIYVSMDGRYVIPDGNAPDKIRHGTKVHNKAGYPLSVEICTTIWEQQEDGTRKRVKKVFNLGRLVLDAWKGENDMDKDVDHIDNNPFNNNVDNLQLISHTENMRRQPPGSHKLTPEHQEKMRIAREKKAVELGFKNHGSRIKWVQRQKKMEANNG